MPDTAEKKTTGTLPPKGAALGLAVRFDLEGHEGIRNPRLVVSAATEKVTRLAAAEAVLANGRHARLLPSAHCGLK